MRYLPTVDIWSLDNKAVRGLKIGQWVSAGKPEANRRNCGRFWGVTKRGTVVVAWNGNARASRDWVGYQRISRDFARS